MIFLEETPFGHFVTWRKERVAHLVEMTMIAHDIESLDDVGVLERRAHAKLCRDLFVVLLL